MDIQQVEFQHSTFRTICSIKGITLRFWGNKKNIQQKEILQKHIFEGNFLRQLKRAVSLSRTNAQNKT